MARTLLDKLLDQVEPGRSELTLDVDGYSEAQIRRIVTAARKRGLSAAGTGRWLLIRDLGGKTRARRR